MDPDAFDRVLRKHAAAIGLTRGYSAHSIRATFITTALENGATLDDVLHAPPGMPSQAPSSSTTGVAIIRRSRLTFLQPIDDGESVKGR